MFKEAAKTAERLDTQTSLNSSELAFSRLYKPETLY